MCITRNVVYIHRTSMYNRRIISQYYSWRLIRHRVGIYSIRVFRDPIVSSSASSAHYCRSCRVSSIAVTPCPLPLPPRSFHLSQPLLHLPRTFSTSELTFHQQIKHLTPVSGCLTLIDRRRRLSNEQSRRERRLFFSAGAIFRATVATSDEASTYVRTNEQNKV